MLLEILQLFWLPWNKSAFVRIICHLRCYSLCFICKFKLRWLRSYYSEYCRFSSIIFVHFSFSWSLKINRLMCPPVSSSNINSKTLQFVSKKIFFNPSFMHFVWFGYRKKLFNQALGFHNYFASISSEEKFELKQSSG